jgi:hypothetical protein
MDRASGPVTVAAISGGGTAAYAGLFGDFHAITEKGSSYIASAITIIGSWIEVIKKILFP